MKDINSKLPKIEKDCHVSIPEHQILLSFNGDSDANYFYGWWNRSGEEFFKSALELKDGFKVTKLR